MMFSATFHFGHFGFFGLAQAWAKATEGGPAETSFCARWLYGMVRHPISLGWRLTRWRTPHMTVGPIVFAISATLHVLVATGSEEADLVADLGDVYRRYRAEVPALVPGLRRLRRTFEVPAATVDDD